MQDRESARTTDYNEALLDAAVQASPELRTFSYSSPVLKHDRAFRFLARTRQLMAAVQIFKKGGEEQLHSHAAMDGLWFVLAGRARFYGLEDQVVGEFGRHEGVMIPRDTPYWFESCGDEPLEILQVESFDRAIRNTITTYRESKAAPVEFFNPQGDLVGEVREGDHTRS